MRALARHLSLLLAVSLLRWGQADFQGAGRGSLLKQGTCHTGLLHGTNNQRAAGVLRGPENVYENATRTFIGRVRRVFPAEKGEVQDNEAKFEAYKAKSEAELAQYKQESAAAIIALVSKVNSLTPVGSYPKPVLVCFCIFKSVQMILHLVQPHQADQMLTPLKERGTTFLIRALTNSATKIRSSCHMHCHAMCTSEGCSEGLHCLQLLRQ